MNENVASDVKHKLDLAATTVRDAVLMLNVVRPTMEQFLREAKDMESFGAFVRPDLYFDRRRERMSKAVGPLFQAAIALLDAHANAAEKLVNLVTDEIRKDQTK